LNEDSDARPDVHKPLPRLALTGFVLGACAATAALASGIGYRFGWWHHTTGFSIFEWAVYGAAFALVLSVAGLVKALPMSGRRGLVPAIAGTAAALPLLAVALQWEYAAQAYPPINDITTDTEDPPAFWDVPNPVDYPGTDAATLQRAADPDLLPLELGIPPNEAFAHALAAVEYKGWDIITADAEEGRIEATDRSILYGFKDDVVVRVMPSDGGARIDVRSRSRIGRIDRGTNARRIRAYLNTLSKRVATARE